MAQAPPQLENDQEVIQWMVLHLDARELAEFLHGLETFNRRPDREKEQALDEFREWWTSWIVSLRLHLDSDYQLQSKDSLVGQRRNEWGSPVDAKELRARFPS